MARSPRLIHPVPVWLRQLDREGTAITDDNLREPVGQARRELKPVKLRAQVKDGRTDAATAAAIGAVEHSDGYLLFLTADLRAAGVTLQRGDRIVQIGEEPNAREDLDYYLLRFQYLGHYPHAGGATLVKAFYEDRAPSRQRGDL